MSAAHAVPESIAASNSGEALIRAQIEELAGVPGVGRRFGQPLPNNYVLMLSRCGATVADWGQATAPLNVADEDLLEVCAVFAERGLAGLKPADDCRERLQFLLRNWRANIAAGTNLVGCLYAGEVAGVLEPILPMRELVRRTAPDLAVDFLSVPPVVREVVRINLYLPVGLTARVLGLLLAVDEDDGLLGHVDRIEVAKRLRPDADWAVPGFPTLMLYVGLQESGRPSVREMTRLLVTMDDLLGGLGLPAAHIGSMEEFAVRWSEYGTITQSFRLYKRYLRAIGVLDDLYDGTLQHSVVRPDRSSDHAFCASVREAIARQRFLSKRPTMVPL